MSFYTSTSSHKCLVGTPTLRGRAREGLTATAVKHGKQVRLVVDSGGQIKEQN